MSARRSNFTAQSVSYGAVGASLAADLVQYPPPGFWAGEHSARLGTGRSRFASAREEMWQWGIHSHSGLVIVDVTTGTEGGYHGLNQREPSHDSDPNERMFTPLGHAYVNAGATLTQRLRIWRWHIDLPARVVLVIDEDRRAGYALGSLPGHPVMGEQAFILELRDDDSVWLTVRQLGQLANERLRWLGPIFRWQQLRLTKRFLRALHPTVVAVSDPMPPTDGEAGASW